MRTPFQTLCKGLSGVAFTNKNDYVKVVTERVDP